MQTSARGYIGLVILVFAALIAAGLLFSHYLAAKDESGYTRLGRQADQVQSAINAKNARDTEELKSLNSQ